MQKEFGAYLKRKRNALGLNQRVFAKQVGISYSYISSLERGKRPAPSAKILKKIEKALKLNSKEKELFEQLAAKTKAVPSVSPKIANYVNSNNCVFQALSFAESNNIEEREWQEFLDKMRKRYY